MPHKLLLVLALMFLLLVSSSYAATTVAPGVPTPGTIGPGTIGPGTIGGPLFPVGRPDSKRTIGVACVDSFGRTFVWTRRSQEEKIAYFRCLDEVIATLDESNADPQE